MARVEEFGGSGIWGSEFQMFQGSEICVKRLWVQDSEVQGFGFGPTAGKKISRSNRKRLSKKRTSNIEQRLGVVKGTCAVYYICIKDKRFHKSSIFNLQFFPGLQA